MLVEGDAAGDRPPTCRTSAEPCFTLKTSSGGRVHRAFLARVGGEGSEIACMESAPSPCITAAHESGKYRAFLLNSNISGDDGDNVRLRNSDDPAFTTTTASMGRTKSFIVDGQQTLPGSNGERTASVRHGDQPVQTVTATAYKGMARAWLEQGRVVSMSPRALGRFQTLPDWYVLPEKKTLASKIIGNGFPCLAAEKIMRQLWEAIC